MDLVVDPHSSIPPYEQVRLGVIGLIDAGSLAAEDRLPTVRELAAELGLANNTVAKAYRELEMSGVTETRGRNGTFVAARLTGPRRQAITLTKNHVAKLEALGIRGPEMLALLKHEIEASTDY